MLACLLACLDWSSAWLAGQDAAAETNASAVQLRLLADRTDLEVAKNMTQSMASEVDEALATAAAGGAGSEKASPEKIAEGQENAKKSFAKKLERCVSELVAELVAA